MISDILEITVSATALNLPWAVIVANKDASIVGQFKQALNTLVQLFHISTRKVTTGRPHIRHEKSVTGKDGIANHEGNASGGMPRCVQDFDSTVTQFEFFVVLKEQMKLTSIGRKVVLFGVEIKDLLKQGLYRLDVFSNCRLGLGKLFTQIVGPRQVIGVDMCLDNVVDRQPIGFAKGLHLFVVCVSGSSGAGVKVHDGVNNHGMARFGIFHNVGAGISSFMEEASNLRSSSHGDKYGGDQKCMTEGSSDIVVTVN